LKRLKEGKKLFVLRTQDKTYSWTKLKTIIIISIKKPMIFNHNNPKQKRKLKGTI
jgi:hypothetical protein